MSELLKFFVKYSSWFLFALYIVAGCALLFARNPYQHHVYLTSANSISSAVYKTTNNVTSYFSLREINEDLQHRNSDLELEIYKLKEVIRDYQEQVYADTMTVDSALTRYQFLIAHVINNSINRSHNYITIEKGRLAATGAETSDERCRTGLYERCEFLVGKCHAVELAEHIVTAVRVVAHRHSTESLHHTL